MKLSLAVSCPLLASNFIETNLTSLDPNEILFINKISDFLGDLLAPYIKLLLKIEILQNI